MIGRGLISAIARITSAVNAPRIVDAPANGEGNYDKAKNLLPRRIPTNPKVSKKQVQGFSLSNNACFNFKNVIVGGKMGNSCEKTSPTGSFNDLSAHD
jgi:hypothetical protein